MNLMPHTATLPLSWYCTHHSQLSQLVSSIFLCLHCSSDNDDDDYYYYI